MLTKLFRVCQPYRFSTSYAELVQNTQLHRVQQSSNLKELLDKLYCTKPTMHCILFKSDWNPVCTQAEQMYQEVSNKFSAYKFHSIVVNSQEKAGYYFGIRHYPTVLYYALGTPMGKHVGLGYDKLEKKLIIAQEYLKTSQLIEGTDVWEGPQDLWKMRFNETEGEFNYWAR